MGVHPIRLFPDRVLRTGAKPIPKLTPYHKKIINDLIDTLRIQPGGIGIAAPQIGYSQRIAIVDVSSKDNRRSRLVLINPVVLSGEGESLGREGCMSLPDYTGNVKRMCRIRLRYRDESFTSCELVTDGIEAICIQHELDHLNGYLFIDRVSSLKRDVFRRKRYLR